jgi:UPF0716 family protein affecting phage T7 exclusion
MELLLIASLMLASAMAGVYFTREQALKQLNEKQEMLDHVFTSLSRAVKLNDQMLHMINGMNYEEAALQAELDELWRTK